MKFLAIARDQRALSAAAYTASDPVDPTPMLQTAKIGYSFESMTRRLRILLGVLARRRSLPAPSPCPRSPSRRRPPPGSAPRRPRTSRRRRSSSRRSSTSSARRTSIRPAPTARRSPSSSRRAALDPKGEGPRLQPRHRPREARQVRRGDHLLPPVHGDGGRHRGRAREGREHHQAHRGRQARGARRPARGQPAPPSRRRRAPRRPRNGRIDAATVTAGSIAIVGLGVGATFGILALSSKPSGFVTGRDGTYDTLQSKTERRAHASGRRGHRLRRRHRRGARHGVPLLRALQGGAAARHSHAAAHQLRSFAHAFVCSDPRRRRRAPRRDVSMMAHRIAHRGVIGLLASAAALAVAGVGCSLIVSGDVPDFQCSGTSPSACPSGMTCNASGHCESGEAGVEPVEAGDEEVVADGDVPEAGNDADATSGPLDLGQKCRVDADCKSRLCGSSTVLTTVHHVDHRADLHDAVLHVERVQRRASCASTAAPAAATACRRRSRSARLRRPAARSAACRARATATVAPVLCTGHAEDVPRHVLRREQLRRHVDVSRDERAAARTRPRHLALRAARARGARSLPGDSACSQHRLPRATTASASADRRDSAGPSCSNTAALPAITGFDDRATASTVRAAATTSSSASPARRPRTRRPASHAPTTARASPTTATPSSRNARTSARATSTASPTRPAVPRRPNTPFLRCVPKP